MKKGLILLVAVVALAGCKQQEDMGGTSDQYRSDQGKSVAPSAVDTNATSTNTTPSTP